MQLILIKDKKKSCWVEKYLKWTFKDKRTKLQRLICGKKTGGKSSYLGFLEYNIFFWLRLEISFGVHTKK